MTLSAVGLSAYSNLSHDLTLMVKVGSLNDGSGSDLIRPGS